MKKRPTFKNLFVTTAIGASMIGFTACGNSGGSDSGSDSSEASSSEKESGVYKADLNPVADRGDASGLAVITVKDGEFVAEVDIAGGASGSAHAQYIAAAENCDKLSSEQVLVPLDGDLSKQAEELDGFPVSDEMGNYFYSQVESLERILNELRAAEGGSNGFAKLNANEKLSLDGKKIVVYGVSTNEMPEGSTSVLDLPAESAMPIACGSLALAKGGEKPEQEQEQEGKPEGKPEQQQEQQQEGKPEGKPEQQQEQQQEGKPEGKPEQQQEQQQEGKPEQQQEQQQEQDQDQDQDQDQWW